MILADFTLGHALITVLSIFVFMAWILVLFTIIGDLFRDHEMSGLGKAVWIFFLIFIPFLTALIYLIARGDGMRDRAVAEQRELKAQYDEYIRDAAGGSQADELQKLTDLRDKGALSPEEFERAKTKLLD